MNPPALVREVTVNAFRSRIGSEQYSRVLSESGDILLIDHIRDCRTVLKLKPGTLYPHAFYNQVYYRDEISVKLHVVDLATGNILPNWEYDLTTSKLVHNPDCFYSGKLTIISPMAGDLGVTPMDATLDLIGI